MLCRSPRLPCCAGVFILINFVFHTDFTRSQCRAGVFYDHKIKGVIRLSRCAGVYSEDVLKYVVRLPCCAGVFF